jgi:hypothetical protein
MLQKIKFKQVEPILKKVACFICALYFCSYLILTLNGEYKGPVSSGKTKLFGTWWNAQDEYVWQPKYLTLEPNYFNGGGLIFSPLIELDRKVWHKGQGIKGIMEPNVK